MRRGDAEENRLIQPLRLRASAAKPFPAVRGFRRRTCGCKNAASRYSPPHVRTQIHFPSQTRPATWIIALLWLSLTPTLFGAEVARWEAASGKAQGILLERAADSDWHLEKVGTGKIARLKPNRDYYSRAAYHLSLTSQPTGKLWLIVEFLDRGHGLITLSPGVSETRQWGIARVNTGRIRRAVFSYEQSPPPKSLRIEGLDYLRAVILTDEQPPLEPAPLVEPAVKFAVPSERVTAAAGTPAVPIT